MKIFITELFIVKKNEQNLNIQREKLNVDTGMFMKYYIT